MSELEILRTAFRALAYRRGRAILTMIGIVIGVAAIIATFAIGAGAQKTVKDKIYSMGENYLSIYKGSIESGKKVNRPGANLTKNLTLKDLKALCEQVEGILSISPMTIRNEIISCGQKNMDVAIKSGNEELFSILNRKIALGSAISREQVAKKSKVIVLGKKLAKELFAKQNPIGKKVKIKNMIFTVIGVAKKIENYFGIADPNTDAYVVFDVAKQFLLREKDNRVGVIALSAISREAVGKVARQARRVLRASHNLGENESDDFTIIDQDSIEGAANASGRVMTLLLLMIAVISLIVGGVGVMNIMLVCVAERTREIGIRMALGATRRVIMRQFLYEAIILCGLGGIIGAFFGVIVSKILSLATGWGNSVSVWPIFVSLALTTLVGLISGYYPAKIASKMNPVTALAEQ